ncbi:MAG: DUF4255 domain-containing protein [Dehalococcoidales bacterium]|nr:DUF4255 domain-containing protein [Dehalococcoidales bacterium]
MISELDESIKKLIITKGELDASQIDIEFEAPDREWSASISKPTVNIYLYDIRENHQLRGTEWVINHNSDGTATRKKSPSRIDISYLITVWANDVSDEHRLLWHVMSTLFRYPEIPEDALSGDLVGHMYPIKTSTAQPDGLFNNPSDFWAALDNKIKASIYYVVTLPLDKEMTFTAPTVKTKIIDVKPPETDSERIIQIGGVIQETGKPVRDLSDAKVLAKEVGMTARINAEGYYTFPNITIGKHTFKIIAAGKELKEMEVTIPSDNYDLEI